MIGDTEENKDEHGEYLGGGIFTLLSNLPFISVTPLKNAFVISISIPVSLIHHLSACYLSADIFLWRGCDSTLVRLYYTPDTGAYQHLSRITITGASRH